MNKLICLGLLSIVLFGCSREERHSNDRGRGHGSDNTVINREKDYDNTGVNIRDRDARAKTPFDQLENEMDRTITQKIRQAVVGDDSLSFNAKNIKIITQNGIVTLRGPVKSVEEKNAILSKVNQVAGVTRVEDQLDIEKKP